ncbi:Crp/Fnr family transcriptional regulator [Jannaschia rubra]|uniref:Anaerobic regulatory protein n=1 Tax=Jannaschia rubra TaxID=282197 RepID=A0A0M6XNS4_9RHOB|nr:Crp/Fnr family transcriptional regulator [Jannaschia rubra]CTQ32739.1 Anaerobic regulatory protein [Jannaschia rubra]SFF88587.1 cAMP-binding domain of CRP or a regulatory subunit of cAMP-dependent protein kinases [Jannaschia rubra]
MPKLDESLLTGLPPFLRLDRPQIRSILDQATTLRVEPGHVIFHEGDEATRFFLLLDGFLRVVRVTPEGEHVTLLHLAPGQLFGFARALGRTSYPATSVAAAESLVLWWPTKLWSDFAERFDGFATETYATIGRRMGEMNDNTVAMATQQVEQRVASALLRLVNQTGRRTGDGIEVGFPVTRQDLSEMTGTTLHTVSRMLSAWEKRGIVESRRKHITVREPHQLVLLSEAMANR